jgi:seryl-tRNA synthetase
LHKQLIFDLDNESFIEAMTRRKLTTKEIIYNKVEEMVEDEDKWEDLQKRIQKIKDKRAQSAKRASLRIMRNAKTLRAFGLKTKMTAKINDERIK